MMGIKGRAFAPLVNVSLEDLVPADHFYRHLERTLDLSFVRDLVRPFYAAGGRPSIDPVVFFKLQLALFFEDIRSERLLMRTVADRLSVRWYLGYDLDEGLPDHSSLTKIRERYGLDTFRRFFEAIVDQCQEAHLVWGKDLYVDATKVAANASLDSVKPRFAVEAHRAALFATDREEDLIPDAEVTGVAVVTPLDLPVPLSDAQRTDLAATNATRQEWIERAGRPARDVVRNGYRRVADFRASLTDPAATLMPLKGGGLHLGYHDHYVVDGGKARIILQVLVTPSEVMENQPALDLLWRSRFRWRVWPQHATGDTTYGTLEIIKALEDEGIRAYMPLPDVGKRHPLFGLDDFAYDAARDTYTCPHGTILPFYYYKHRDQLRVYRADAATCNACPLKTQCTTSDKGRTIHRNVEERYLDRVRAYHQTEAYEQAMGKRKVWVEPLFAEAKDWHGLRRFRLRRLWKVNCEALGTATGQNLKRLLSWRGWGRRPWPGGTRGLALGTPVARYLRV